MIDDLSSALALRLRDLARMADRLDRLESGTGEWLTSQDEAAAITLAFGCKVDPCYINPLLSYAATGIGGFSTDVIGTASAGEGI